MSKKLKKQCNFCEKDAEIRDDKMLKNYTVTYCQTLKVIPWLLRLEKPKNAKNF